MRCETNLKLSINAGLTAARHSDHAGHRLREKGQPKQRYAGAATSRRTFWEERPAAVREDEQARAANRQRKLEDKTILSSKQQVWSEW